MAEWKFASTSSGEQYATMAGTCLRPVSHAGNLDHSIVSVVKNCLCLLFNLLPVALHFSNYGGGSGPIHYFSCAGDETHLLNCSHDLDVDYCSHFEDVGVMCYFGKPDQNVVSDIDI